ncbi:MAG TPA: class I SAM-dependent methyltransferase, partial [Bacteroidia bacterium]|nr:class I SAM-dependent methyltransferase [Bacteroidia bacterium]
FQNLELRNGIWYSKNISGISFPEDGYDRLYSIEENSFWYSHRNNCIIETVKHFSPRSVIYDVGGGNGYVASGLEKAGLKTVLIEPGQTGVLNAKKRGLTNIVCSTLEDINLKEGTLDAIGIFDVLEHIKEDGSFINLLNKYLKPGGMLYITVPAFKFLWSKEDEAAGHYRRYTLKLLENILKKNGFETMYSTYIFSILPVPVFFFRTITSLFGISKNPNDLKNQQHAHEAKKGLTNNFLEKIWKWELSKIRNTKKISIGGSCLLAARKNSVAN